MKKKRCDACEIVKPISEFYVNKKMKDGYYSSCKECRSLAAKERYQLDPKKHNDRGKQWYQTNKVSRLASVGVWRANNQEKHNLLIKNWRKSHPEKIYEYNKNQSSKDPEKVKAREAVRQAIRSGRLASPKTQKCSSCPSQAAEWHHHKGYNKRHWLDVIALCVLCHRKTRGK